MGTGAASWASGPGMLGVVRDGHWSLLSGLPAADFNMVLVDSPEPASLAAALEDIDSVGAPAILCFAAEGKVHQTALPAAWSVVAEMPIMVIDLAHAAVQHDPRVRRADAADVAVLGRILAAAYGFDQQVAEPAAELFLSADGSTAWILEDNGAAVSAVVSTRVDDSVGIWAMATPPEYARRGYGRALLGSVLATAQEQGAQVGLLGATEAGYPLYESTGWHTVEHWTLATSTPSAQFG
jgi:GNAT superfamily N-acetyltransferase